MQKSVWVILKYKDEMLLLKRSHKSNNPSLWNFPGGGVEKNESVKLSAVREVWEEAGIKIKESDLEFVRRKKLNNKILYYYKVSLKSKPTVNINKESSKYKWVTLKNFPRKLHKPTNHYYKFVYRKRKETASLKILVDKVLEIARSRRTDL